MDHLLTEAQSGTSINVSSGDLIEVRLPENPTTGYRWQLDSQSEGLEIVGNEFRSSGGTAGAAGERVMKVVAKQSGSQQLRLGLKRGWETGASQKEFAVSLSVAD